MSGSRPVQVGDQVVIVGAQDRAPDGAVVRVRLLSEPCMWTWEICDSRGDVIARGWASDWAAYDSAEEAYAAGRQALTRGAAAAGP